MSQGDKYAILRRCRRVWAVASIHSQAQRLTALHRSLEEQFQPGDRLVYLGNATGHGTAATETIDELLAFRRRIIARPGMFAADVAHLRGSQEEMWFKLLQLQLAPNPREVLDWMLAQGVDATIAAYGGDVGQGRALAAQGAVALTRWTGSLRAAMQRHAGHEARMTALRRAAYTDDATLLFVHAGLDPNRPLTAQNDSLWWNAGGFGRLDHAFDGFRRVIRGFDRAHAGIRVNPFTTSIDAGCGFGGPLIAACFDPGGEIVAVIEA
jgi:serine/threonine protein phosphatase 1